MKNKLSLDPYLDPKSGVLRNKLGLTDPRQLGQREAEFAALRSYELAQTPLKGKFDLAHLQALHRHLFGDVYDWAGELRRVDIAKENSYFATHGFIASAAKPIFSGLAQENFLSGLNAQQFSTRAAHYLSELNALHPFREGNGRTQREYISHLAYHNGHVIDWSGMKQEDMLRASQESMHQGDTSRFTMMIAANLRPRLQSPMALPHQTEASRKPRDYTAIKTQNMDEARLTTIPIEKRQDAANQAQFKQRSNNRHSPE